MREALVFALIVGALACVAGLAAFVNAAEGGGDDDGIAFQVQP